MKFKLADWIEHKSYGNGQIVGEDETYWVVRFVEHGEKKMAKKFVESQGHPPCDGFTFPTAGNHKSTAKKALSAVPDFPELFDRFLSNYPGGLSDAKFYTEERNFKDKAVDSFVERLGRSVLASLLDEGSYQEVAKRSRQVLSSTNLAFKIEIIKFSDALKSAINQKIFAEALSDVLYGHAPEEVRFERYTVELAKIGVCNWPIATYFQFFETRGRSMFMKPTVAKRMAESVGIMLNYKPEPNWLTYSKLQETAKAIRDRLEAMGQTLRSDIDVQSFMWCAYQIAKQ